MLPLHSSVPAPDGKPLVPEEIAALADGDLVTVVWHGGNGPHVYVARRDRFGVLRFYTHEMREGMPSIYVGGPSDARSVWPA